MKYLFLLLFVGCASTIKCPKGEELTISSKHCNLFGCQTTYICTENEKYRKLWDNHKKCVLDTEACKVGK